MSADTQAVLDAALADVGLVREHGGDNRGWEVEAILEAAGGKPGDPWCSAFVSWIGRVALGKRWPLPVTTSCQRLHDYAYQRGMLLTTPGPGDVFLVWHEELKRFGHTGFVVRAIDADTFESCEGNSNDDGSRNGYGVFKRVRKLMGKDRCIRWTSMAQARLDLDAGAFL